MEPFGVEGRPQAVAHQPGEIGEAVAGPDVVGEREQYLLLVIGLAEEAAVDPAGERATEAKAEGGGGDQDEMERVLEEDLGHRALGVQEHAAGQQRHGQQEHRPQDVAREQVAHAAPDHDADAEDAVLHDRVGQRDRGHGQEQEREVVEDVLRLRGDEPRPRQQHLLDEAEGEERRHGGERDEGAEERPAHPAKLAGARLLAGVEDDDGGDGGEDHRSEQGVEGEEPAPCKRMLPGEGDGAVGPEDHEVVLDVVEHAHDRRPEIEEDPRAPPTSAAIDAPRELLREVEADRAMERGVDAAQPHDERFAGAEQAAPKHVEQQRIGEEDRRRQEHRQRIEPGGALLGPQQADGQAGRAQEEGHGRADDRRPFPARPRRGRHGQAHLDLAAIAGHAQRVVAPGSQGFDQPAEGRPAHAPVAVDAHHPVAGGEGAGRRSPEVDPRDEDAAVGGRGRAPAEVAFAAAVAGDEHEGGGEEKREARPQAQHDPLKRGPARPGSHGRHTVSTILPTCPRDSMSR